MEQDKARIQMEQEIAKQALTAAVERMQITQKWQAPEGLGIEIDMDKIKRSVSSFLSRS